MTIEITEEQRQAMLLALAKLSLTRPGWHPACLTPIAELLHGKAMYEQFRSYGPDVLASGVCWKCGCTNEDCSQCIAKTGEPCSWADATQTLCTACK